MLTLPSEEFIPAMLSAFYSKILLQDLDRELPAACPPEKRLPQMVGSAHERQPVLYNVYTADKKCRMTRTMSLV